MNTDPQTVIAPPVLAAAAAALRAAGEPLSGALSAEVIAHGRSNVTAVVRDDRSAWVLRMPPEIGATPTAHDVAREFRITAALAETSVPVARAVALVEDDERVGRPFFLSEFAAGSAIRTQAEVAALAPATREQVAPALMAGLASVHAVDCSATGLAELERPGSYVDRQFSRWSRQWAIVGTAGLADAAALAIDAVGRVLPAASPSTLVHGDYRIDNTILALGDDVALAAIVDWELATVGDPVADVATTLAYRHPALDLVHGGASAWTSDLLPAAEELASLYAAAGGRPLRQLAGHLALANFKIAVIAAGIAFRLASSDPDAPARRIQLARATALYFELAREAADGGPRWA